MITCDPVSLAIKKETTSFKSKEIKLRQSTSYFTMNVMIFWDTAPCSPYANRRFRGKYYLHLQGKKSAEQETSLQQVDRNLLPRSFLSRLILESEDGGGTFL
jgi:hypothetical protein